MNYFLTSWKVIQADWKKNQGVLIWNLNFLCGFQVGKKMRYVQITTSIQTRDPVSEEKIKKNLPLIQSELLMLMQQTDFDSINSADGKALLLKDIEDKIIGMFASNSPNFEIEQAMMTGFVIQ